ncbi:MAG TPA: YceI family protein [Chloroflexota bacterium]|nr:YceI family protein [Chloroflexota bacterium]
MRRAPSRIWRPVAFGLAVLLASAACSLGSSPAGPGRPNGGLSDRAAASPVPSRSPIPPPPGSVRVTIVTEQTAARYRAQAVIIGRSFPTEIIGETRDVSGSLVIRPDGNIAPDQSRIVVNLQSLASNDPRIDDYVKANTLQTDQFPEVIFAPRIANGIKSPLPTEGPVNFQLGGDLTIRGVSHPMSWIVTGDVNGDVVQGSARAVVSFDDFSLPLPVAPNVVSVDKRLTLEIAFDATKSAFGE